MPKIELLLESLGYIISEPCTSVHNFVPVCLIAVEIFYRMCKIFDLLAALDK